MRDGLCHVPGTEQRDFHVRSPLSKQYLLFRNTTPRERESSYPNHLLCICTRAEYRHHIDECPRRNTCTSCPISTCLVCSLEADADSLPMWVRAAAQKGCKMRWRGPSLLLFKMNDRTLALGIPSALWHAPFPRLLLETTNNKITRGTLDEPTWGGLLVCGQDRYYALVPILDSPSPRALIFT